MPGTVKATEQSIQCVSSMRTIIDDGLQTAVTNLIQQGQLLSDPNTFEGRHAGEFRSTWPSVSNTLNTTVTQLGELRQRLELINQDIMAAGGNA
ncbi:MAG: hypothetical protein WKF43_04705 [Acidimicrobiales bacterium]